jgi:integrase
MALADPSCMWWIAVVLSAPHLQRTYGGSAPDALTGDKAMQAFIGEALVDQLKPAVKPFEIRDTVVKGFLLRVQPSGRKSYYAEYGRGRRIAIGRADVLKPKQARAKAKEILAGAQLGDDPMEERRLARAHTLRSFIDEAYQPWAEANIRTAAATVARLKAGFCEHLDKHLGDLTPWIVEKWRSARLKNGTKPATVNRDLDDLKSSLNKAVAWGLLDANPIAAVKRSRTDDSRAPRFLSVAEEARLRRALDEREERIRAERDSANAWRAARGYELLPDLRRCAFADYLTPLVIVSLHTGMRRGELFKLRWPSVELGVGRITVHGTTAKSNRTRHIPLNSEARETLAAWRKQTLTAELVFPGKGGAEFNNVRRSWEGVLVAAKIAGFRWHDLRHTFASKLVMAGVDLNTVRELLGHSDYKMTQRYAHLAPEHKAAAVERLVAPARTEERAAAGVG